MATKQGWWIRRLWLSLGYVVLLWCITLVTGCDHPLAPESSRHRPGNYWAIAAALSTGYPCQAALDQVASFFGVLG
ncbi:hypothetical protein H6F59_11705 [Nodosilinea sp. FACHB-141]|nr:hypothetical protein [Nodosilinea sp. FACHB-141]MBD2112493.1 hypothetical protein [Nodosilinea sp. FACHB-141]